MATKPQNLSREMILPAYKTLHLSRVLYKSTLFMQNKPNLPDSQMNVNTVITKDYENERLCRRWENKPNQTQFLKISDFRNLYAVPGKNECKTIQAVIFGFFPPYTDVREFFRSRSGLLLCFLGFSFYRLLMYPLHSLFCTMKVFCRGRFFSRNLQICRKSSCLPKSAGNWLC